MRAEQLRDRTQIESAIKRLPRRCGASVSLAWHWRAAGRGREAAVIRQIVIGPQLADESIQQGENEMLTLKGNKDNGNGNGEHLRRKGLAPSVLTDSTDPTGNDQVCPSLDDCPVPGVAPEAALVDPGSNVCPSLDDCPVPGSEPARSAA